jgi:hypothetical protein
MVPIGVETADMLANEVLSRHLRDGKGLARAGNARVRCGIQ